MKTKCFGPMALAVVTVMACSDPTSSHNPFEVSLEKGGPNFQRVDFTISDGGMSLLSDGKGMYMDGVCGVGGQWGDILFLTPAASKLPKNQQASCGGPRRATVALAVKHISDNPHIDDDQTPAGSGVFDVANLKFGSGPAFTTTINATTPFCGTAGLRYNSVGRPGSSDAVREDLGGGLWHMYTLPWPDNKGYCENNGVVVFWHVSFDLNVQIKP